MCYIIYVIIGRAILVCWKVKCQTYDGFIPERVTSQAVSDLVITQTTHATVATGSSLNPYIEDDVCHTNQDGVTVRRNSKSHTLVVFGVPGALANVEIVSHFARHESKTDWNHLKIETKTLIFSPLWFHDVDCIFARCDGWSTTTERVPCDEREKRRGSE